MAYFKDAEHLYKCLGALFEKVRRDDDLGKKLRAANMVIRFVYTDPAAEITIDLKNDPDDGAHFKTYYGACDLKPEVDMSMKADIGHKFWHGKVNLVAALSRRQIVAKGPIPKILKLLPVVKPTYQMYPAILQEIDEETLVIT